ncbi:hypothetical protein ALTERO38_20349 [Alteromonas sp. 38]|nr:hypothetical protein ALTER154_100186 [Alteromonas sp. 154]VXB06706.1 hypothetical protein ALTERO38_20349 [Alteromonas sp. 38]
MSLVLDWASAAVDISVLVHNNAKTIAFILVSFPLVINVLVLFILLQLNLQN